MAREGRGYRRQQSGKETGRSSALGASPRAELIVSANGLGLAGVPATNAALSLPSKWEWPRDVVQARQWVPFWH